MYYLRKNGIQNYKSKTNLLFLSAEEPEIEQKRRVSLTILNHCSFEQTKKYYLQGGP
jgi:hypothetical protein